VSELIIYATREDGESIRNWIDAEPDIAWIIKERELDGWYRWKAVRKLESLGEQDYSLWHVDSGPLNVPSGSLSVPDEIVRDPFAGWSQRLERSGATSPWFGSNLPGPFHFTFSHTGSEAPGNIGRSSFSWAENRYAAIGKPAHPSALNWWRKLNRFVRKVGVAVPWVSGASNVKRIPKAYCFPSAASQLTSGRGRDINPTRRKSVA
jgi:hypothetical protein